MLTPKHRIIGTVWGKQFHPQRRRRTSMTAIARLSYLRYHQMILATQQGRMQSIILCSIPLHESIYLLFLPQISLHIYHMVYGPIGQRQVSWTYNLHYIWDLITHPCPRCLLLAILHVPDKQLPKLVAQRNRSHHGSLLVSSTTVVFANTRHTSICWEFRRPLCVGYVMPFQVESPATEVTPLRVTAGHHTNGARRAETVIVLQPDSWRYSRNYGDLVSRQRRNGPRGFHLWRRQNYAKYEIPMSYGNIQANNAKREESPRG